LIPSQYPTTDDVPQRAINIARNETRVTGLRKVLIKGSTEEISMPAPISPKDHHDSNGRVVLEASEARQGALGRPVLYVLVIALVLAMLAWAGAEYFGKAIDTQTPKDSQQNSAPATEPASENENIVDDNPLPGEKRETEPALIDPQSTGNQ
jgi:hypothetical protein